MAARREQGTGRHLLAVLALLALALRIAIPAGFMPGSSLAVPLILCPDQGPMPAMAMGIAAGHDREHHSPGEPQHQADHLCVFAGLASIPLATVEDTPAMSPAGGEPDAVVAGPRAIAPGRGLAAPPPPSHAPPTPRA